VSQRSIADCGNFWYTADVTQYTPFWFRKTPWQDPEEFRVRSPITYIDRVKTPLMLVEGESDMRTPPEAGGEIMFRALKYLKKPVVMVRFPDKPTSCLGVASRAIGSSGYATSGTGSRST
jgi:dipeptidyl aminopeptidase/acylaminoacyl peptidase